MTSNSKQGIRKITSSFHLLCRPIYHHAPEEPEAEISMPPVQNRFFIVILMTWIALQETLRIAGTQLRADLVAVFVGVIDKENGFERKIIAGRV
jgi:hypothetical protein